MLSTDRSWIRNGSVKAGRTRAAEHECTRSSWRTNRELDHKRIRSAPPRPSCGTTASLRRCWKQTDQYLDPLQDLGLSVDPASNHRTMYASGNPINVVDEDGHCGVDVFTGPLCAGGLVGFNTPASGGVGPGSRAGRGAYGPAPCSEPCTVEDLLEYPGAKPIAAVGAAGKGLLKLGRQAAGAYARHQERRIIARATSVLGKTRSRYTENQARSAQTQFEAHGASKLKKSIRSYERRMDQHAKLIRENRDSKAVNHWNKEIRRFQQEINARKSVLRKAK